MAGLLDIALDKNPGVAEGFLGLLLAERQGRLHLLGPVDNAHALAAAAGRRFQQHRIADLLGRGQGLFKSDNRLDDDRELSAHRRFLASSLEVILSPMTSMTSAGGPMKTSPAAATFSANSAFSERKP